MPRQLLLLFLQKLLLPIQQLSLQPLTSVTSVAAAVTYPYMSYLSTSSKSIYAANFDKSSTVKNAGATVTSSCTSYLPPTYSESFGSQMCITSCTSTTTSATTTTSYTFTGNITTPALLHSTATLPDSSVLHANSQSLSLGSSSTHRSFPQMYSPSTSQMFSTAAPKRPYSQVLDSSPSLNIPIVNIKRKKRSKMSDKIQQRIIQRQQLLAAVDSMKVNDNIDQSIAARARLILSSFNRLNDS